MNAIDRTFWFRRIDVGFFTMDELPHTPGRYACNLWRDKELRKALKADGRAVCYYYTGDSRVFFTVRQSSEEGIFELSDFETELWPLPGTIAQQLGEVFHELVEKKPFSEVVRLPLNGSPASGRALRLVIWQCHAEVLFLASTVRRWWVVDWLGFHQDADWPLTDELLNSERGACENPSIKFATDGQQVRFGMNLGMTKPGHYWYAARQAPLRSNGRFDPDKLVEHHNSSP